MNIKKKNLLIHLFWGDISVFINFLLFFIPICNSNPDIPLAVGIIVFVVSMAFVLAIRFIYQISFYRNREIAVSDIVGCYVFDLAVAGLFIYLSCTVPQYISVVLVSIGIVIEIAMIPVISYRYRIRNKIKALFKKRK
ncbi:MAG: hypothetical protein IJX38_00210 [Clostridia bacterium]|nr:hypothetical protein [Clostridia bacterium]